MNIPKIPEPPAWSTDGRTPKWTGIANLQRFAPAGWRALGLAQLTNFPAPPSFMMVLPTLVGSTRLKNNPCKKQQFGYRGGKWWGSCWQERTHQWKFTHDNCSIDYTWLYVTMRQSNDNATFHDTQSSNWHKLTNISEHMWFFKFQIGPKLWPLPSSWKQDPCCRIASQVLIHCASARPPWQNSHVGVVSALYSTLWWFNIAMV